MQQIEQIFEQQRAAREAKARMGATTALKRLAAKGIEARLIGSLAPGSARAFSRYSDVDILVLQIPSEYWRYRVEGLVEEALGGLPFDVVYADEIPEQERGAWGL